MQEENVTIETASEGIEALSGAMSDSTAILGSQTENALEEELISQNSFEEKKQEGTHLPEEIGRTFDITLADILTADDEARNYIASLAQSDSRLLEGRDEALKEYYAYVRRKILQDIISSKNEKSIEERLKERYGNRFAEVENEARKSFEAMAFLDALKLLNARQSGDISSLEKFYDSVSEKLRLKALKSKRAPEREAPPQSIEAGGLNEKANIRLENFI